MVILSQRPTSAHFADRPQHAYKTYIDKGGVNDDGCVKVSNSSTTWVCESSCGVDKPSGAAASVGACWILV